MESKLQLLKFITFWGMMLFLPGMVFGKGVADSGLPADSIETESFPFSRRFVHRFEMGARPAYIIPTNSFLEGENYYWKPIEKAFSAHLKYSFQSLPNSCADRIYGGAYQGVGLAYFNFGNKRELGNPLALYLFQGARIGRIAPWLSINYEWNFGLSAGWEPYNEYDNHYNTVIGSEVNAYLNMNFYLSWMLSRHVDITSGVTLTHFSNGNTKFPNAGLNTVGVKLGLVYNFNRTEDALCRSLSQTPIPQFTRHVSYDLVLFGSWRRKGVAWGYNQVASPEAYTVLGFNFAPMYNLGYKLRMGVSLDGVYDASANVYTPIDHSSSHTEFIKPPLHKQLALGLSGRAEYVMPYFTVGLGLGTNIIHGGGDLESFYQILALKIELTRNSFLHIGYSLHNFHSPNYLMLGIGYRFNNKYPSFRR